MCYGKYGNRFWHRAPFWFIPASLVWAGLELLLHHFQVIQKIIEKYPDLESVIKKAYMQFAVALLT